MYSDRGGSIVRSLPHITIACAAVWAGSRLIGSTPGQRHSRPMMNPDDFSQSSGADDGLFAGTIDYRLVALGSLLPDMVDRAIRAASGRTWSRDQHLLGHTLLLNAPVVVAGISLARRRQDARLLVVGAAAMTHLLVDPVIRSPRTLLWPLLGRDFPESRGLNRPLTMLTQIGAAAAVLATLFTLQRRGRLSDFIARGSL
jgi:LexA-binding, inner membrane-associated putative hydrolase